MFIKKDSWDKFIENYNKLMRDYDSFSDNLKEIVDNIDISVDKIKEEASNKVYVITNNAIFDDEIDYHIYGVATSEKEAKKLFESAIKDAKCDSDFENINPVDVTNGLVKDEENWQYVQTDKFFELYLNGEYNSNNFCIELLNFDIDHEKIIDREI